MLFDRKNEIVVKIIRALRYCVDRIKDEYVDKNIYAFTMYPSSGFRDLGIAFSTREDLPVENQYPNEMDAELFQMLQEHPDLLEIPIDSTLPPSFLVASEWEFVRCYSEAFSELNDLIYDKYDDLYDLGYLNSEINRFFSDVVVESFMFLKTSGCFSGKPFEKDILMGIQFPDEISGDIVVESSKLLNSDFWHNQILKYF